jgi:hypothetical protein
MSVPVLSHKVRCPIIPFINRFEDYVEPLKSVTFVNLSSLITAMVFADSLLPFLVQHFLTLVDVHVLLI